MAKGKAGKSHEKDQHKSKRKAQRRNAERACEMEFWGGGEALLRGGRSTLGMEDGHKPPLPPSSFHRLRLRQRNSKHTIDRPRDESRNGQNNAPPPRDGVLLLVVDCKATHHVLRTPFPRCVSSYARFLVDLLPPQRWPICNNEKRKINAWCRLLMSKWATSPHHHSHPQRTNRMEGKHSLVHTTCAPRLSCEGRACGRH